MLCLLYYLMANLAATDSIALSEVSRHGQAFFGLIREAFVPLLEPVIRLSDLIFWKDFVHCLIYLRSSGFLEEGRPPKLTDQRRKLDLYVDPDCTAYRLRSMAAVFLHHFLYHFGLKSEFITTNMHINKKIS